MDLPCYDVCKQEFDPHSTALWQAKKCELASWNQNLFQFSSKYKPFEARGTYFMK